MQWSSTLTTSFEIKWSPKIKLPYNNQDLEDDIPLVFRKPSWQLKALTSVLITPVLYRLYLIMVTIGYIIFSKKPCQIVSSPSHLDYCPVVDLSWTGVFPCEVGWRESALAVLILSAVLIACYSLITTCLVRWNPRKQSNFQFSCTTSDTPTKIQVRVQSTNRLMLAPTLSLCLLLLIFHLLLQSGDIEANPGPTFTSILTLEDLQSVYGTVIKAAGNWFDLALALGVSYDILRNIRDTHRDNQTCLLEMLTARLKTATLTYSEIYQSLRTVGQNDVAEAIEEEYLVDDISPGPPKRQKLSATNPEPTRFKQHFEEAMKAGFVSVKTVNVILMGPAGSGKTSVKDLVLNNEAKTKTERNSTPPLDKTIEVRSVENHHMHATCKGQEWKEITPQDLKKCLSLVISQSKPSLHNVDKKSTSAALLQTIVTKAAVKAVVDDLEEISAIADLTSVHESSEELFGTMTIRVTDSGGQPQFHDIAPLFTRGTSAGVYVMKLIDKFNDYPSDEFYVGGQQVGTPSLSHMSHRETILSLIQSLLSVNTHIKKPRCIFVGTFKDLIEDPSVLSAILKEKNEELRALIPECFRVYRDRQMTQQILALNAISRDEDTQTIAQAIRNAVEESPFFEDKVPLRWFALELSLQEFCTKVERRILTISECISVAKELQSDADDLKFALDYFDKICIAHYYPQKLPGIVFVDPQIPLEIINDLVQYAMSLREGGEDASIATQLMDPKWKLFRDGGILTLDMLQSVQFKKHFRYRDNDGHDIFVPIHMIELMKKLLLITPLTTPPLGEPTQFFMPALLKSIPQAELKNCCNHEPSVDPLLVRFTNGCIRAGVFCCLVVFLMKTCGWERYSKLREQVPQARNCIKLRYQKDQCFVTLVDSITHIEVYVKAPERICEHLCPKIKEDISEGIRASQKALHYSIDDPEFCFFCPYIHVAEAAFKSHHAEINVDYYTWVCSEKSDECNGELKNKHLIWFVKKGEHPRSQEDKYLTVDEIAREVGIKKEVLDHRCSSEDLQEIGRFLPNWLKYAQALLSKAQIQGINVDNNLDYEMKCQKVLEIWHKEFNTSYRILVDICFKFKDGETARKICEIVKESNPSTIPLKREDKEDH